MRRIILSGIYPAIVTTFDEDGKVDFERLDRVIDYTIDNGASGVVIAGTTGEFTYLSTDERRSIIKYAVEHSRGEYTVIAGTGAPSTNEALELTRYASRTGADASLLVTPYYLRPDDKEIYDHYAFISDRVDIPIILYNIPQVTGVSIPWWVVEALSGRDNIVGIKDSSGDMPYFMTLIEKVKGKMSLLCGHDEVATLALIAGADGLILASANIIPDIWVNIHDLVRANRIDDAIALQRSIQTLTRLTVRGGALAVKAALNMMGLDVGACRHPLSRGGSFRYEDEDLLRHHLYKLGKIRKGQVYLEEDGEKKAYSYPSIDLTPSSLGNLTLKVGESLTSPGSVDIAHIDLILGYVDGPVGDAFKRALVDGEEGHKPAILSLDGEEVRPRTLLIPTVRILNDKHRVMVYDHAGRGVARAVLDWVEKGYLPGWLVDRICIIVHVFVHPAASNEGRVEKNNYKAMKNALIKALEGRPSADEILSRYGDSRHPFKYTP